MTLDNPIALGRTAEIYPWSDGQVLKLYRPQWGREEAEREARLGRSVYAAGLPAPKVGEVIQLEGRFGLTYEYVKGPSLVEVMRHMPWRLPGYTRAFARLHTEIHAQTLPGLPPQRQRLQRRIRAAKTLSDSTKEAILELLQTLPDGDRISHGDFHPLNVLVTARGFIVVDWVDATLGNPLADVARTLLLLELSDGSRWSINAMLRAWFHRFYPTYYDQVVPIDNGQLGAWHRVMAAARLAEDIPEEIGMLQRFVDGPHKKDFGTRPIM